MQLVTGTVRAVVLLGVGAVLFLALAGSAWGARERARDPLTTIHRAPGEVRVLMDSSYEAVTAAGEARTFRDLVVATGGAGTIRVTTSRPAAESDGPMPLVMVLAGLRTGRESLAFLDEHGPNILGATSTRTTRRPSTRGAGFPSYLPSGTPSWTCPPR
jgi:hypothetical protein